MAEEAAQTVSADTWRPSRLWPYAISAGLHLAVFITLLLWPASPPQRPTAGAPIKVSIVSVPPKVPVKPKAAAPVPQQQKPPQAPRPETAPRPRPVAQRPVVKAPVRTAARPVTRPTPPAIRPTPRPTPTPDKLTVLRRYPEFQTMTDEQIRQLELPPGLKNWDEFAKLAQDIGLFRGAAPPPPTTGGHDAPPDEGSDPVWTWREDDGAQIGIVAWWGGKATISWKPGDRKASGLIIPEIPRPSPVPYNVPVGLGSDRESVAAAVIRMLRLFNADGDPNYHPFPELTPAPVEHP
jgi:hypothetical protein